MRKPGKPNTFQKGMQMDLNPLGQAKETYRYAKNIRLLSYQGKNVSIQPYSSDKKSLKFETDINTTSLETPPSGFSNLANIGVIQDYIEDSNPDYTYAQMIFNAEFISSEGDFGPTNVGLFLALGSTLGYNDPLDNSVADYWLNDVLSENYSNNPELYDGSGGDYIGNQTAWLSFHTAFMNQAGTLPINIYASSVGGSGSDGVGLTLTATLTMTDESIITVDVELPETVDMSTVSGNPIYFETIIANEITSSGTGVTALVMTNDNGASTNWVFQSTSDNQVSNVSITANGEVVIATSPSAAAGIYAQSIFENIGGADFNLSQAAKNISDQYVNFFDSWVVENHPEGQINFDATFGENAVGSPYDTWRECIRCIGDTLGYAFMRFEQDNNLFENDFEPFEFNDFQLSSFAVESANTSQGDIIKAVNMQILGHYAFSDYLVLLGKWIGAEENLQNPADFVIKVSQRKDGTLATPDTLTDDDVYEQFFIGDLGFSNKRKLKVVGAEENYQIRRIYFTDGDIPLRTINVAASPTIYSQYTNNPGYFDLFVETKLSVPEVTGFMEGGSLESIGHAYCFRYKTKDGRYSRKSPVSNPASLPVTNSSMASAFTKGGNLDANTSKSLTGVIKNLDKRFAFVEMIHVPYINNVPGVAQVFNTIPIPQDDSITQLSWTHTGSEIIDVEITIDEFGTDLISWDTCKALEVKDNRLFCGNLKGVTTSIDADFTVVSYNSKNEHHSYDGGNPHLYHDLLYSWGGINFNQSGNAVVVKPETQVDGKYCKPQDIDMYRYIKNPSNSSGAEGDAFFSSAFDVPQRWVSNNEPPTPWSINRGIFGAESKYFNESNDDGEKEGVRVTFRVLGAGNNTPAPAVQLDENDNLITTGNFKGARAPFYKVSQGSGGDYYATYANPVYNSNYVGYRRGEVYRFGLLFYDKKGSPMFVKRIGDIRMPEHSTEYYTPNYSGGEIYGIKPEWPFYYQTSRSNLDSGFVNMPGNDWEGETNGDLHYQRPYADHESSKGQGHYGCVLYPYFEIKLSSKTASKIGGYSIVRVERTEQYRTIVTSGVLQRAVKYADNHALSVWNGDETGPGQEETIPEGSPWVGANRCDMDGKFGNYHLSIFTPTIQEYCSNIYGNSISKFSDDYNTSTHALSVDHLAEQIPGAEPIGGSEHWSHSNVFTIDSPDAMINSNFSLNFSGTDRIKITEQRYCVKQNVSNGGTSGLPFQTFLNSFLAGGSYPGTATNNRADGFTENPYTLNLFACLIDPKILKGEDVYYEGLFQNFGGYNHQYSPQWSMSTSWNVDWYTFDTCYRGQENMSGGSGTQSLDDWNDNDDYPNPHGDGGWNQWLNTGIYTKYYSKRIGAYPMYGMARPDWTKYFSAADSSDTQDIPGVGTGFSINTRKQWYTEYAPERYITPQFSTTSRWNEADSLFTGSSNLTYLTTGEYYEAGMRACHIIPDRISDGQETNSQGELLDSYPTLLNPWWNESVIRHAAIVNPGDEISAAELGSDRPYRNATMWHDFHRYGNKFSINSTVWERNMQLGGNITGDLDSDFDDPNVYPEVHADFSLSNRKIVLSLSHHAMLPLTRHCLDGENHRERVQKTFGGPNVKGYETQDGADWDWGPPPAPNNTQASAAMGGSRWSQYSPEVTMASIAKQQNGGTMYGGNSINAFAKNTFISTGHFQQVNTLDAFTAVGSNGSHVFGGDTYICNFSVKQVHNPETDTTQSVEFTENAGGTQDINFAERSVLTAYTCPVETETNVDLRHGLFFGGDSQNIPKQISDDFGMLGYNTSYDASNNIQLFNPKPIDFVSIDHWPSTIAFSEPKFPGDFNDNYSVFPVNQIKDLDYKRGAITQMFLLQNNLFALQNSGTCQLSVNPRVMIPSGEGAAIQAATGTDNVIERFDYISESLGSQHFHGLAVSDMAAYYYDDNASKFLRLGRGKGGGFGVSSLGDGFGMQSFFQQYHNVKIHDRPLFSPTYNTESNVENLYREDRIGSYEALPATIEQEDCGGISIGYDAEYGEILLTIYPYGKMPYTIIYNENIGAFTSFVSKRPSNYINFKNRLYCTYDNGETNSNDALYLANGYEQGSLDDDVYKYLTFGEEDYYILGADSGSDYLMEGDAYTIPLNTDFSLLEHEIEAWGVQGSLISKEPIQVQFVINDEGYQPKIFDNLDINIQAETDYGNNYLYFRKFAFKGSANRFSFTEYDVSEYESIGQTYSNAENGFYADPGKKMWYSVKEGTHHIPFKGIGLGTPIHDEGVFDPTCRGTYSVVSMMIGWDVGGGYFSQESSSIKNEGFNILSVVPYYRYSRR